MQSEFEPAPGPVSSVDLALLHAARIWGGEEPRGLWAGFPAERRSSLRWAWETGAAGVPAEALDRLRREHEAQLRPDLARVHVSWWVRALKNEPPSVQRSVSANLPLGVAEALREALGLSPDDLRCDRPAHPAALENALALWTVRLVGDLPERDDDPPAIAALSRFDVRTFVKLLQTTGLAKWSLTGRPLPDRDRADQERLVELHTRLSGADPQFARIAARDVEELGESEPQPVARAGMTTFARLLLAAETYRTRWALQHIPYSTARALRSRMKQAVRRSPMLVRWETDVLRVSWTLLHEDGRIAEPWGTAP